MLEKLGCGLERVQLEVNQCSGKCKSGGLGVKVSDEGEVVVMSRTEQSCSCCTGLLPLVAVHKIIRSAYNFVLTH